MKITNEQLKQIIKEEIQAVMNESLFQLLGIGKAAKASAARRRADLERQRALSPDNPYKRGYGPGASTGISPGERERAAAKAAREAEMLAAQGEQDAADAQYAMDSQAALEALGQAKLKAIQALGRDEDGDLPYMHVWGSGNDEKWLGTYYDGPLGFYEALDLAKDAGEISNSAIDMESGGFHLDALFPGKYIQE